MTCVPLYLTITHMTNERPTADELKALARIAKSAEWELVKAWLERRREVAVQGSLSADTTKSRQSQGRFVEIDEFIKITTAAAETPARR